MQTHAFTADAARALAGPDWLRERRVAAAEQLAGAEMPTTAEEVWRYSPIGELDLARYRPVTERRAEASAEVGRVPFEDAVDPAAVVVVVDGLVVDVRLDPAVRDQGLFVGRLVEHPDAEKLLGAQVREAPDVFVTMNEAFAPDPVAVVLGDGAEIARPVVVLHHCTGDGAGFPRVVVHAGEDSGLRVLEVQRGGGRGALSVPVTELRASRAARLGHVTLQQLELDTWQLGNQTTEVDVDATFVGSVLALGGGGYVRTRTDCRLTGRGATGNLASLYFGRHDEVLDFRIFQDHLAPNTNSNLLFKGAVDDRSKSIYTGLIHVAKDARGSNALQTNRNIKLSEHAWAESVPNLQIENNEVSCSHASTVGPIDEEQRFYLESRGVPPAAAERLVVAGFFRDALEQVPVPEVAPAVREAITAKLDEVDAGPRPYEQEG